jgi:two-component system sensor histidine kinase DesK
MTAPVRTADDGGMRTDPLPVMPLWMRSAGLLIMMAVFLAGPLSEMGVHHWGWRAGFEVLGLLVMIGLLVMFGLDDRVSITRYGRMWLLFAVVGALGVALPLIGGVNWIGTTAIAATLAGRFLPRRATIVVVGLLALYTMALPLVLGANHGLVVFGLLPIAAAVFPYQTQRRMRIIRELRETRAELARVAVAEERIRIARDLHDLLGHSLSMITLKSELAGRMVDADPARARTEMAEVEAVARRSLSEVREAVTAYRRPTLKAELAAARAALGSAGVGVRIDPWPGGELPDQVDALFAWAVREGTTNVIRHSAARSCAIRVTEGAGATLDVTDDGGRTGAAQDGAGSGLTGLAERAGQLGGELAAGPLPDGGFRLRVSVPVRAAATEMEET